jgi:hypothetical protein
MSCLSRAEARSWSSVRSLGAAALLLRCDACPHARRFAARGSPRRHVGLAVFPCSLVELDSPRHGRRGETSSRPARASSAVRLHGRLPRAAIDAAAAELESARWASWRSARFAAPCCWRPRAWRGAARRGERAPRGARPPTRPRRAAGRGAAVVAAARGAAAGRSQRRPRRPCRWRRPRLPQRRRPRRPQRRPRLRRRQHWRSTRRCVLELACVARVAAC